MKLIDHTDLESPQDRIDPIDPIPFTDEKHGCLGCGEPLRFTPAGAEMLTFARMCEIPQSIVTCPNCKLRMVVTALGEIPMDHTDEALVIGAPTEGWSIAKLL